MLDLANGWNISFAGCGFMGVYYVGVYSCLLERAHHLLDNGTNIFGSSCGSLTGAMIACKMPAAMCCKNLMAMASEARKHNLSAMHPAFNPMKIVRDFLTRALPDEAHLLATGRLGVSLTRVSDGKNVLVSEFDTKEDLIQALVCSCFIPLWCGVIPPSYHGVRYVDGALSDNLPHVDLRNTITVSPFSGESDICPMDTPFYFHEVRHNNVSIQVNYNNMYTVARAFFPPEPKEVVHKNWATFCFHLSKERSLFQVMAEICNNGYKDALRFLQENNFLKVELPLAGLSLTDKESPTTTACWEEIKDATKVPDGGIESTKVRLLWSHNPQRRDHWWLDEQVNKLTADVQKVFCEACKEEGGRVRDLLPLRVASYILMPFTLPVQSAYFMAQRLAEWEDMSSDLRWLCEMAVTACRQVWKKERSKSETPLRKFPQHLICKGLQPWACMTASGTSPVPQNCLSPQHNPDLSWLPLPHQWI